MPGALGFSGDLRRSAGAGLFLRGGLRFFDLLRRRLRSLRSFCSRSISFSRRSLRSLLRSARLFLRLPLRLLLLPRLPLRLGFRLGLRLGFRLGLRGLRLTLRARLPLRLGLRLRLGFRLFLRLRLLFRLGLLFTGLGALRGGLFDGFRLLGLRAFTTFRGGLRLRRGGGALGLLDLRRSSLRLGSLLTSRLTGGGLSLRRSEGAGCRERLLKFLSSFRARLSGLGMPVRTNSGRGELARRPSVSPYAPFRYGLMVGGRPY